MTNEIFIDGDQDTIQLRVQGHTTQNEPLQTWEDSETHVLAQMDENGQLLIDGQLDNIHLRVQGHSTQDEPLQTWEDSAGSALTQVAGDGRVQVGDLTLGLPDALVEANNDITLPFSGPLQGVQSRGRIQGAISNALAWVVNELELLGSGGVSGLHTALRARLFHNNSGDVSDAELRAGDFEAVNQSGSSQTPVGRLTGLHSAVTNAEGAYLDEAVGIEVVIQDAGTIQTAYGLQIADVNQGEQANYALYTGLGVVRLGDQVGVGVDSPATPLDVDGAITVHELSADPADPDEGAAAVWLSDGTGSGDDGDVLVKVTAGGSTKTVPVIDHSVGALAVTHLQGRAVADTAPTDGQVLAWDDGASEWAPVDAGSGSVDASDVTFTPASVGDWDSDTDPGNVDDALDQLANRTVYLQTGIGARVYNSTNISVPHNGTYLTFDSERFDSGELHSTASNTDRLTVPVAGVYYVFANIEWAESNGWRTIDIRCNGVVIASADFYKDSGDGTTLKTMNLSCLHKASADDYFQVFAYQNTGGAVNVYSVTARSPEFGCFLLGNGE